MTSQKNQKSPIKNIMIYFLLFLLGDLLNSLFFDMIFSIYTPPYDDMYAILRTLGCIVFTCIFFWIYTEKILHMKMKDFGITFGVKKWGVILSVILPVFVIVVYLTIGDIYVRALPVDKIIMTLFASMLISLKAGILEEMLFRGFIMKLMEQKWRKSVAILMPSFIFSLLHIPSMETFSIGGLLLLLISGTLVGVMFSLVTYKGKSIGNSVLIHTLWNFAMVTSVLHITTEQAAYGKPIISIFIPNDNILLTGAGFGVEASIVAIEGYALVCLLVKLRPSICRHR